MEKNIYVLLEIFSSAPVAPSVEGKRKKGFVTRVHRSFAFTYKRGREMKGGEGICLDHAGARMSYPFCPNIIKLENDISVAGGDMVVA